MTLKRILAAVAVLCVLAAPAVALAASAAGPGGTVAPTTAAAERAANRAQLVHRQAAARNVRLARILAHRTGRRLPRAYARRARLRSTRELQRSNARLRAALDGQRARRRVELAVAGSVPRAVLASIASCESHGNPRAVGGGGLYRGAYQMTFSAWRSVGGKGDPARASMAEQTRRAALLYRRSGAGQWPVCGR